MAWESSLDRLILQQVHLAEEGERRLDEVVRSVRELYEINPKRPESAFHLGYARVVLGADLPEPTAAECRRWDTFGRLRAHDRRGERDWVADLLVDEGQMVDLLTDPRVTAQVLPIAMRALFCVGNLNLAVRAIDYLVSTQASDEHTALLVDAALSDLVSRLESHKDEPEQETTLSILTKCIALRCFEDLPGDVRARYHRARGKRLLEISEFEDALGSFSSAYEVASDHQSLRSSCAYWAALAVLRIHDVEELSVDADRAGTEDAAAWIERATIECASVVPEALFVQGLFAYETGNYKLAIEAFDDAIQRLRRVGGRDRELIDRIGFYLAGGLLATESAEDVARALRLMDQALGTVRPDLETFYSIHESLKDKDRRIALRFLDAIDIGRGTAPDQLLFVALEYLGLGEATPAQEAAERVLKVSVDLDQRIEAMRVVLTAKNMQGDREGAQHMFAEIRDLLIQRGAFDDLEKLLTNEEFVGQALDYLEIKLELIALYEIMDERSFERATLQQTVARSLRSRKDVESLREAYGLLQEASADFPELVRDDLQAVAKLLEMQDAEPPQLDAGPAMVAELTQALGRAPRILVVGGNERQRRHHPKFEALAKEWVFDGEWLMANYSSPQKLVSTIGDRIQSGVDLIVLLHWNRHETTEPALELARKAGVPARTVHYAGFTSLQVCLADQLQRLGTEAQA